MVLSVLNEADQPVPEPLARFTEFMAFIPLMPTAAVINVGAFALATQGPLHSVFCQYLFSIK